MRRRASIQTLADTLSNARVKGEGKSIRCFVDALQDEDVMVRTAAVQSLRKVTLAGDGRVLSALLDVALYDSEWQTRKACIEAVESIAINGDKPSVQVLSELTRDRNAWIREAAVKALEVVARETDGASIQTVHHNLQDTAWEVRRAAARTLMLLEPEGDRQDTIAPKVLGREDKRWFNDVQGFLRKPLFMPLR